MKRLLPALAFLLALSSPAPAATTARTARAAAPKPAPAPAPKLPPGMLADSTTVQSWRLENGLEVRVRDIPGATSVAIAMAYRAGTAIEPPGQPDLAEVLAQLQYTAPVGSIPERTFAEMPTIRPLGWAMKVNSHAAVLMEVVPREQLAGLVREVSERARGVQLDDSCLAHAISGVRRRVGEQRFGALDAALYSRVHDLAAGQTDAQVLERSRGTALARLTRAGADSLLRRYYVASNASLALVGDFSGIDLKTLVERQFGAIPAGSPQPEPGAEKLEAQARISVMNELRGPIAAMGILAPALEDSLHPDFFLDMVCMGGWWNHERKEAGSGLASHFQYSLFDQPELAHFEFELSQPPANLQSVFAEWNDKMDEWAQMTFDTDPATIYRKTLAWTLGGPFTPALLAQARTTPAFLANLANMTATRAIWKGDAFWNVYLGRFSKASRRAVTFMPLLQAPEKQVLLVLQPRH